MYHLILVYISRYLCKSAKSFKGVYCTVDNKQNLEEENLVTFNLKGQRWWPRLIEIKFGIAKVDSF